MRWRSFAGHLLLQLVSQRGELGEGRIRIDAHRAVFARLLRGPRLGAATAALAFRAAVLTIGPALARPASLPSFRSPSRRPQACRRTCARSAPCRTGAARLRRRAAAGRYRLRGRCFGGVTCPGRLACVPPPAALRRGHAPSWRWRGTLVEASGPPDQDRLGFLGRGRRFRGACRFNDFGVRLPARRCSVTIAATVGRRRLGLVRLQAPRRLGGAETSASSAPGLLQQAPRSAPVGSSPIGGSATASPACSATAGVSTACASGAASPMVGCFGRRILFGSEGKFGIGYRRNIDDCRRFGLQRRCPFGFRFCRSGFRGCSCRLVDFGDPRLDRGCRPGIRAIAQTFQDLFDVVGVGAEDRHHRRRHRETAAVESAVRPQAGAGLPGQRRADQVGEPLQNVDAHGAAAKHAETGELVEGCARRWGRPRPRCGRRQARGRHRRSLACPCRHWSAPTAASPGRPGLASAAPERRCGRRQSERRAGAGRRGPPGRATSRLRRCRGGSGCRNSRPAGRRCRGRCRGS